MLKFNEMKSLLKMSLPLKRYKHSLAVYETALKLAAAHGIDKDKVGVAALLHDCGRQIPSRESLGKMTEFGLEVDPVEAAQPVLLHAKLGVYYARNKYGVTDREILDAIRYHSTGTDNMTPLAMAVYLADLLEPSRDFAGIEELRKLAMKNMEETMICAYRKTICYLLEYDLLIHPDCIAGYNQLVAAKKEISRRAMANGRK